MNFHTLIQRLLFLACLVFGASQALAIELADVKVDESANVAAQDLKLNGAGIRTKVFFKVYVGALYLTEVKTTAADVLAQAGAKRVKLTMLRELGSDTLSHSLMEGIDNNTTAEERAKIATQLTKLTELFGKVPQVNKGDVLTLDWIPASGTVVQLNGKQLGEIFPDVAFYNALLKIWLGEKPVDGSLKKHLLNEKTE